MSIDMWINRDFGEVVHFLQKRVKRAVRKRRRRVYSWESNMAAVERSGVDIFLASSDLQEHYLNQYLLTRDLLSTYCDQVSVIASGRELQEYFDNFYEKLRVVYLKDDKGVAISHDRSLFINFSVHSASIKLEFYGKREQVEFIVSSIGDRFEVVVTEIEWIYGGDGSSIDVPLREDRKPDSLMYPFLGQQLHDYYDRFIASSASILLLIGAPGTGKTSFIRGLMQHTKSSAVVTYDEAILAKDYVFANFIEGDKNLMVIEDADNFLKARSDGNTTMHKFLNIGDGLVTTKNKKLIFSTNLPSTKDIDPALIRPGRCFDIIHFRALEREEAIPLAKAHNLDLSSIMFPATLAEIFSETNSSKQIPNNKFGFI